jgi:hypothetical protein
MSDENVIEPEIAPEVPVEEAPVEAPVVEEAPKDMTTEQLAKAEVLDAVAATLSNGSLEFGWTMDELWHLVYEDYMQMANGKEDKAVTEFLSFVQDREATVVPNRATITEQWRVARAIPRDKYGVIVENSVGIDGKNISPSFHQLRSVLMSAEFHGPVDKTLTNEMISWSVENHWPPVADIRKQRLVLQPAQAKEDPATKHWNSFVKMAQVVIADAPESNHAIAAQLVLDQWKAELS